MPKGELLKKLQELAPEEAVAVPFAGGFGPSAESPVGKTNLTNLAGHLVAAVMSMQASEMAPTALQLEACKKQTAAFASLMAQWNALKAEAGGGKVTSRKK